MTAENEVKPVKLMVSGAPRPILEVGVGTGYFAGRVGAEAGLDPSMKMLTVARMRGWSYSLEGWERACHSEVGLSEQYS